MLSRRCVKVPSNSLKSRGVWCAQYFREYGLPLLLLAATVVTTTANGARFMQNFLEGMPPVVRDTRPLAVGLAGDHPDLYITGWAFSFTLLGILLIHEFGHYFACRVHGIRATLPWVLPAPTLSGTAGAVIQIRSRIPSRNALMDVGIYGPLAGYVASALAVARGVCAELSRCRRMRPTAIVRFGGEPLTIRVLHALLVALGSDRFRRSTRSRLTRCWWPDGSGCSSLR